MARHSHGHALNELVLQPGNELLYENDGSITGSCVFKCDSSRASQLRPRKGDSHPKEPLAQCYSSRILRAENQVAIISADYLGIEYDPTMPQIDFLGSVGEEAIETHPDFTSRIAGTKDAPLNDALFDDDTGEFLGFPPGAPNNLGGARGFLLPQSVVRITYFTSRANWGIWNLGRIAWPPANIPQPPGSRNWLMTNWGRKEYGAIYQITEEYTASGPRGWNSLLYG